MSIVLAKKNACMYLIPKAEPKSKRVQPGLTGMVHNTLGQGTAKGAVRTCAHQTWGSTSEFIQCLSPGIKGLVCAL